jgi:hypothetical protein
MGRYRSSLRNCEALQKYWWDKTQKGENRYGIGRDVRIGHALLDRPDDARPGRLQSSDVFAPTSLGPRFLSRERGLQFDAGGVDGDDNASPPPGRD